nr:MAG TPA: hypothetical protein [Caudoviricetes sp.]
MFSAYRTILTLKPLQRPIFAGAGSVYPCSVYFIIPQFRSIVNIVLRFSSIIFRRTFL